MQVKEINQGERDAGRSDSRYGHRHAVLFIVLVAVFMAVIDGTVVNIALPTMTRSFAVDLENTQWTVTAYLITMTSLLLVFGKVSEYIGRARLFFVGIIIFTASSLACGLATTLSGLIFFRVLQGAGAAMLFSISSALIFETAPHAEQGRSMGYLGSTVAIGSIAGPVVGGLIVDTLGWQYCFFINIPIGILLVIAAVRYLRFEKTSSAPFSLDLPGAAMMTSAFVFLILGLGNLAADTEITPVTILFFCACVLLFFFFVLHERRCAAPLLDLSIFSVSRFSLPLIGLLFVFIANFIMIVVGPFYFEGVLDYRPAQVGLAFLISPALIMIVAPISGTLFDRYRTRYLATAGVCVVAFAFALLSIFTLDGNVTGILCAFVLAGIGNGFFQSPNNTAIMSALPREKIDIASSVTATARNLGMALGVSFGSILLSVQFLQAGYFGDVLHVAPSLLATSTSHIMIVCCLLCGVVALISLRR